MMLSHLRIIYFLVQYIQGVIYLAMEVVAMEVFCESLPPVQIHQVADELIKALQLRRRRERSETQNWGDDNTCAAFVVWLFLLFCYCSFIVSCFYREGPLLCQHTTIMYA